MPETQCKFVVVLVNDTALGSRSTVQLVWVGTLWAAEGALEVALVPLEEEPFRHLPWVQEGGLLNPAVLTSLFGPAAPQFRFVVLDIQVLTDLLRRIGEVSVDADTSCWAEKCLTWVYAPTTDPDMSMHRLQALAMGVLS